MDRTEKMMQLCKANEELGHQAMANAIVMAFPDATEEEIRGAIAKRIIEFLIEDGYLVGFTDSQGNACVARRH